MILVLANLTISVSCSYEDLNFVDPRWLDGLIRRRVVRCPDEPSCSDGFYCQGGLLCFYGHRCLRTLRPQAFLVRRLQIHPHPPTLPLYTPEPPSIAAQPRDPFFARLITRIPACCYLFISIRSRSMT